MFLTRMGPSARFIVTGDDSQVDLPRREDSGLIQAIRILKGIEGIAVIRFDQRDIIRHRLVKSIVAAYDDNPVHKVESHKVVKSKFKTE
jgi:phosphate starvation-inducible PhoH-like protein